ncbi:replication protein A 70 kDa DNA-binding subunit [Artemisia annua]|uniref:Replication protein A 70 kDa DNA-binding subunit n=1 Tax=Artemisia annua TaxID=35608 RepID=A0A2U1L9A5_ARTAN|nr:replication protein A 70 kDa DNA-binding subunit [Artemisia annua]
MNELPTHQGSPIMQNTPPHHARTINNHNFHLQCDNNKGIQINDPEPRSTYDNQGFFSVQGQNMPDNSAATDCTSTSSTTATNLTSTSNTSPLYTEGVSHYYIDIGDCQYACQYCKAAFKYGERVKTGSRWQPYCKAAFKYGERVKTGSRWQPVKYNKCCGGGQVYLQKELDPPMFFKQIFKDKHFLENIRAYNQMFSMTSFGAEIDDSVNDGRGPMAESSITPIEPKDKQKMLEVEANIKDLKSKHRNRILKAKIYRAWMARDPPDTTEKGCLELTLWDDLAETFKKEEIDRLEKPVIIAVSSCRVSKYYNKLQLSSTPATYYYINPRIPQLQQYQAEYKELFNLNPPLEIVRQPYEDIEKEKIRNRFPLAVLLTQTPKTNEGVRFTCEGSITSIQTSKDWYYPSCTTCIQKVRENDGVFDCRAHGPLENPSYRYNFKGNLTDNTATVTMTFFTPKADKIVGTDCNSLMTELNYPGPRDTPQRIHAITGKNHIFQFHFNTTTKQGSATPQKSCPALTTDIPDEELLAIINYTPPAAENVKIEMPPTTETKEETPQRQQVIETKAGLPTTEEHHQDIITQETPSSHMQTRSKQGKQPRSPIPAAHTPPQPEHDFSKEPLKAAEPDNSKSTSAKRTLFQEKTADTKKIKKE